MIAITIPLFVLLLISSEHINAYPSASLYEVIINHGHGMKDFQRHQRANNDNYLGTSNMNDEKYIFIPHKRLIDF